MIYQAIYPIEQFHFMFNQMQSRMTTVKGQTNVCSYPDNSIWNIAHSSKSVCGEKWTIIKLQVGTSVTLFEATISSICVYCCPGFLLPITHIIYVTRAVSLKATYQAEYRGYWFTKISQCYTNTLSLSQINLQR